MRCGNCGAESVQGAAFCAACGAPLSPASVPQPAQPPSWSGRAQTSGMAIASLVLGICGLFTGGISALAGLVLGIVALGQIRQSRGRLEGSGLAVAGICVSGFVLLLGLLLVLSLFFFRATKARRVHVVPGAGLVDPRTGRMAPPRETRGGSAQRRGIVPRPLAATDIGKVRECQSNMKIINTAAQAYFAQNHEWPDEVSDMLPPGSPRATTPAGLMGGQLTERPVCPFGVHGSHRYEMVPVHESPNDPSTPVVGYVVDWMGHFRSADWSRATVHEP